MARYKETIWQRDFSLGAVRPEAVDRDDTEIIDRSVKEGLNTTTTTTGQIEKRPGSLCLSETSASNGYEVVMKGGRVLDLQIYDGGFSLFDKDGVEIAVAHDWEAIDKRTHDYAFEEIVFWVVSDPANSNIIIGSQFFPMQVVRVSDSSATIDDWTYVESASGVIRQPYWLYESGITLQPSARTGVITVSTSDDFFQSSHVGTRLRYGEKELEITGVTDAQNADATVIEDLPPTKEFALESVDGFGVGDAVEELIQGGYGFVVAVDAVLKVVTVFVTSDYVGFKVGNDLASPSASSKITSIADASTLAATSIWEEPMFSESRGYPGFGAQHQGRLYLCDLPNVPLGFAASTPISIYDFNLGSGDADAFADELGAGRGGQLKYILSNEDLLFLTTRGLLYQQTRDGSVITPSSIAPIVFSGIGVSDIKPAVVDDGCVFVDAVGSQVYSAFLEGNVYQSWRARSVVDLHSHLINDPVQVAASSYGSETPEQYVYVVNGDGSVSVAQWNRDNLEASWRPWKTAGNYKYVYQCFSTIQALVDRDIDGETRRFRERFSADLVLDCCTVTDVTDGVAVDAANAFLNGGEAAAYFENWDMGDYDVALDGSLSRDGEAVSFPEYSGEAQIGLPFTTSILLWPRRSAKTQVGDRQVKRLISVYLSVLNSSTFKMEDQSFGSYHANEPMSVPPPFRSDEFEMTFIGMTGKKSIRIEQDRPGKLMITKIGYRVTI